MGYRSNVAYIIKFKTMQDRDAYVSLWLAKNDNLAAQVVDEVWHDHDRDPIITFKADDVKWYEAYPEVQAHTEFYHQACELFDASYRFVAIGEDGQETYDGYNDNDLYDYIYAEHRLHTSF
jgi:hypothetical protein